jgi:hypothetical protein
VGEFFKSVSSVAVGSLTWLSGFMEGLSANEEAMRWFRHVREGVCTW